MADDTTKLNLDPTKAKQDARNRADQNIADTEEDLIRLNLDQERQEYTARLAAEQEEAEEGSTSPVKRLSGGVFLLVLIISVMADIAEALTLGTLGWFIGSAVDLVLLFIFGFSIKKQMKSVVLVSLVELIPGLDILPFRTFYILFARFYLKSI